MRLSLKELVHQYPLPLSEKGYAQLVQYAVQKNHASSQKKDRCLIDFHITLNRTSKRKKRGALKQIKACGS